MVDFSGSAAGVNANLLTGVATGAGSDTISGVEDLVGSPFNDSLVGDGEFNRLDGLAGNDSLDGVGGNDTLLGGVGNDTLRGRTGRRFAVGSGWGRHGDVLVSATAVTASLTTNVATGEGADTFITVENLIGSPLNDTFVGNGEVNRLDGLAGNDTIAAGFGNDTLLGGANTDSCNGGAGTDTASTCETLIAIP